MTMAPIWALVTFTADGQCLVDRTSLRASLAGNRSAGTPSFGADDDDDDFGDDLGEDVGDDFGDDLGDDVGDDFGDDLGDDFGDDVGDDFGDDLGDDLGDDVGDDFGDEIGMTPKERRIQRLRRRQARLKAREKKLLRKNRAVNKKIRKTRKGKVVQRNVTVIGAIATTIGQSMTMTLTPRTSLHLAKIFATGDIAATITTIISGDDPVVLDSLDAALISPSAYHGPSFGGRVLKAGVPVTINYMAGSTTAALKLSFYGRARVKLPRC